VLRWLGRAAAGFVLASFAAVLAVRLANPPLTTLMALRVAEGLAHGRLVGVERTWRPLPRLGPTVARAVVAAEDARFMRHHGVDWEEVRRARAEHRRRPRGASTITMQAARSLFLWPGRSWIRKGLEVWLAGLMELVCGKPRILELYLNVVEWGDGVYGAEAAARHAFGVPAAALDARQAALLAAVLPNPRHWHAARPTPGLLRRAARIAARMGAVEVPAVR
jgi:monofunctional biosynthetic peptidoglycan transglycosylase